MTTHSEHSHKAGWSATEIRAALPDGAIAKIARKLRITPSVAGLVVARRCRSRRVEEQIVKVVTKALGREVTREEIFGPPGRRGVPRAKVAA